MSSVKLYIATTAALLLASQALAHGDEEHGEGNPSPTEMLESMRDSHADHDHAHDFEAMEEISEDDMHRTMDLLMDIGLVVPIMNSQNGAKVFMNKGCIVCHTVNGVGAEVGPSFDAADMPNPMNAFEFAARMWRGAPAMAQMQENLLGEMITINGQELADIVAFVHDQEVQAGISQEDIPEKYRALVP